MKRKGFTLVELLVVIAIIALLMSILMPTLAMVRKMAQRAVCGSNLSGIHKAMLAYMQDNEEDCPRAGGKLSTWNATANWKATTPLPLEATAFAETQLGSPYPVGTYGAGKATISASLYLLIKWADVSPKSFICKGEKGAKIFSLTEAVGGPSPLTQLKQAFDFGPVSTVSTEKNIGLYVSQYNSYAYQIPYVNGTSAFFQLSSSSPSGLAVLADKSPYFVISPDAARPAYEYDIALNADGALRHSEQLEKWGNSANHDSDGQNVLFNDGAVSFNNVPYCGMNNDNIYTIASTTVRREAGSLPNITSTPSITGSTPMFRTSTIPQSAVDSLLLNEGGKQGGIVPVTQ
jgi:prepilin-type N-terminal cleavage/methylation domain-containing protein